MVLKELIFNSSTLGLAVVLRTDFEQFLCWGCGALERTDL